MKTSFFAATIAAVSLAAPAFAQGDAAAGEAAFRQCVACHVVANPAGDVLAGRNGRVGPNLYGSAGGPVGAVADFRYSAGLQAVAAAGKTWTEDDFVAYVMDPTGYIQSVTGGNDRGAMAFRVANEADARNLYAYIASLQAN